MPRTVNHHASGDTRAPRTVRATDRRVLRMIDERVAALVLAVDRHPTAAAVCCTMLFFWAIGMRAWHKPFWHDEIYTLAIASLPSVRDIWAAHLSGTDLMPPLNAIVTHAVVGVTGAGRVTARLSPMLGVWLFALVSFEVVRRRCDTVAGVCAVLLVFFTGAAGAAYEARGYGLMLGAAAVALVAWFYAAAHRHRLWALMALALSLAAGVWAHYYAILMLLPIGVGEMVRVWRSRSLDWGIVSTIVAAGLLMTPLGGLARVASSQSAGYWRRATLSDAPDGYSAIFGSLVSPWALTVLALVLLIAVVRIERHVPPSPPKIPAHEVAAIIVLTLLPFAAIAIGILVTGVFVPRYAMTATLGIVLAIPIGASRMSRRNSLAVPFLFLGLLSAFAYTYRDTRPELPPVFRGPLSYRPLLTESLTRQTPVVVSGTLFLQMWYYASPAEREMLHCVADPDYARGAIGTDTVDRGYLALRRWYPVPVEEYRPFISTHTRFRLYDVATFSWIAERLRHDGAAVQELGHESGATLYDVVLR